MGSLEPVTKLESASEGLLPKSRGFQGLLPKSRGFQAGGPGVRVRSCLVGEQVGALGHTLERVQSSG